MMDLNGKRHADILAYFLCPLQIRFDGKGKENPCASLCREMHHISRTKRQGGLFFRDACPQNLAPLIPPEFLFYFSEPVFLMWPSTAKIHSTGARDTPRIWRLPARPRSHPSPRRSEHVYQ